MTAAAAGAPLDEGPWDDLFDFLDPRRRENRGSDRDREAERKYHNIKQRLVLFFASRRCGEAEDLATETLLRVAARCKTIDTSQLVDRTRYFYGVARNVLHEWQRHELHEAQVRQTMHAELMRNRSAEVRGWQASEVVHRCLDGCMAKLSGRARRLILEYYGDEGPGSIERHRKIAADFGKSANALRIECHRIRKTLRACVVECVRPDEKVSSHAAGPAS